MKDNYITDTGNGAEAAAIRVVGNPGAEWSNPGVFRTPLMFKSAAILLIAGCISGLLAFLLAKNFIGAAEKDFVLGSYYILMFGGAFHTLGKLDAKKAALLIGNTIVFLAWNKAFFGKPLPGAFVFVLEMWLPLYWVWKEPGTMEKIGLGKRELARGFIIGIVMATAMIIYSSWCMPLYGLTFKIQVSRIIVNIAQGSPMCVSIFCFFYMVWSRLKTMGLSPVGMILALSILTACMNAPVFIFTFAASIATLTLAIAGFIASMVVMVLSTYFTFGRFRSALPAACLLSAVSALILMAGLS